MPGDRRSSGALESGSRILALTLLLLSLLPAAAAAQGDAKLQLRFVDMASDIVGVGNQTEPNGEKDAHFRLLLDVGNNTLTVNYMVLLSVDANGQPEGGQVWDTRPNGYPPLGVEREGRRLNPRDADIADQVWRKVRYDIYANDSGRFTAGQHFRLLIRFKEGGEVSAITQIGESSAGAPPAPTTTASAAGVGSRFSWRWEGVKGTWKSEWTGDAASQVCKHETECTCHGYNFCGEHADGAIVFWWRDGCAKPATMIRCSAKPQN